MKYLINILVLFTFISVSRAQEVYLKTDPDDVYILKNDSLIGHTPLFIAPALGNVLLSKPGYTQKNINLGNYDGTPVQLKFTGRKTNGSFYESPVFIVFIASAVALGTVTAYFKVKADRRFENYMINGNSNLLNETRRFDTISDISFAALQINFGFLIYYFLQN